MSLVGLLLRVASLVLPGPYRARWYEEALALLAEVPAGGRRWRYAFDTALKVPLMARELRYDVAPPPPRWQLEVAGLALVGGPALVIGAIVLVNSLGYRGELLILLAPLGMVPLVAVRAAQSAAGNGGFGRAVAVTVLAATGPVSALFIDDVLAFFVAGAVAFAWLAVVSVSALVFGVGPSGEAQLGAVTGLLWPVGLVGSLATGSPVLGYAFFAYYLAVVLFAIWAVLAAVRLLSGRADLVTSRPAGPAG